MSRGRGGGVVGDDRHGNLGQDVDVGILLVEEDDVVGVEVDVEHVGVEILLVEVFLVEFDLGCLFFEVFFGHDLLCGGSRGADSTPGFRRVAHQTSVAAGLFPGNYVADGAMDGLSGARREMGVQETVGATVWPDLAVQAGYSSVLYLVS